MCYKTHLQLFPYEIVSQISEFYTASKFHSFTFIGFWKLRFLVFNKDTCITKVIGFLKLLIFRIIIKF